MESYAEKCGDGQVAPALSQDRRTAQIASCPTERGRNSSGRVVPLRSRRHNSFSRAAVPRIDNTREISQSNRGFSLAQEALWIDYRDYLILNHSEPSVPAALFSAECLWQLSYRIQLTHSVDAVHQHRNRRIAQYKDARRARGSSVKMKVRIDYEILLPVPLKGKFHLAQIAVSETH